MRVVFALILVICLKGIKKRFDRLS